MVRQSSRTSTREAICFRRCTRWGPARRSITSARLPPPSRASNTSVASSLTACASAYRGGWRKRATLPYGKTVQFLKRAATGQGNAKFEIAVAGGVLTSVAFDAKLLRLRDGRV